MAVQLPLRFEFNNNQRFSDYLPGGNREAVDLLKKSLTENGECFVYLWGRRGLGKSHLLQAVCLEAFDRGLSAFYLPLNPERPSPPGIVEGLDEIELVCIDDIQCIAGDGEWEKAVFNFFNLSREKHKRLVVSADRPPSELAIGLPDLKTRLAWGLTLKLQPPDEEQLIAVLIYRAEKMGLEISANVGQFLLSRYSRDLGELWRLLDTLDHETLSAGRKLTIPFVKQILGL
ncbi:MAG: DnaA regulatory inactivator Hda [Gammaproteobacteria bacterium]